jgi:hypothetical protein
VLAILMALVLSSAWVAFSATFTLDAGDFPAFYTGALMARHGDFRNLHDERLQAEIQKPLVTRPFPVYFVRPHVYAAFLEPLALLPIRQAFVAFILLSSAVLIGFWYWAYRRFGADAVGLLALFPVAIMSFAFGQDVVLFLGLFVLSYFLFEQDRPMLSGFVLGFVFIKPHLMLLIPIALLVQRRWRMLAGLALAGAMEALVSLALGGFTGAANYVRFLQHQQQGLSPTPERMMNVYAIGINLGLDPGVPGKVFSAMLILLVIACVAVTCWRGQWWQGFGASLIGTLLIAPHTYLYDSTLVLLPAVLIVFLASAPLARAAATAFCTPIPCLLQLFAKPWPVVPSLVLLLLLIGLALDTVGVPKQAAERSIVLPA